MSRYLKEEVLAWYSINIFLLLFFNMWCHLWTAKIPLKLVGGVGERMVRDSLFYSSKPVLRWMETKLMDHFCWSRDPKMGLRFFRKWFHSCAFWHCSATFWETMQHATSNCGYLGTQKISRFILLDDLNLLVR